jgi:signal transduction histidine kinase
MRRGFYRSVWRPLALPSPEVAELRERTARRGTVLQLAALILGAVYVAIAGEGLRRVWFLAAAAAFVPLGFAKLLPWRRLFERRIGSALFLVRYAAYGIAVSLAVIATGGPKSDLWVLYVLVILFVGWCFDGVTQLAFVILGSGTYMLAMEVSGGLPSYKILYARLASLGITSLGIWFISRESRDQTLEALVSARESAAVAEARRAVAEQAQRLTGLQSEFVSTVSHELKTPLTAIIGNLATLQRGVVRDPEVAESLIAAAARHAKRLNALIEDLLTTSRLDEGELPIRSEEVDVLEVASDVVSQLQVARPEGDISLVVDGRVPPAALTDRDHLHRVLLNLADNAIKYGGGAPVRVRVGSVGRRVRFVVEDEGPGIDPHHHLEIFERFSQVEGGVRPKVGGTGLGLHICNRLVDCLGGHLFVSSLPGEGAAFGFTLPARPAPARAIREDESGHQLLATG